MRRVLKTGPVIAAPAAGAAGAYAYVCREESERVTAMRRIKTGLQGEDLGEVVSGLDGRRVELVDAKH